MDILLISMGIFSLLMILLFIWLFIELIKFIRRH